jgi:hypothetical protein
MGVLEAPVAAANNKVSLDDSHCLENSSADGTFLILAARDCFCAVRANVCLPRTRHLHRSRLRARASVPDHDLLLLLGHAGLCQSNILRSRLLVQKLNLGLSTVPHSCVDLAA